MLDSKDNIVGYAHYTIKSMSIVANANFFSSGAYYVEMHRARRRSFLYITIWHLLSNIIEIYSLNLPE